MNQEIDLKKLEKNAWKAYYAQDGLYDIFFGILVFVGALRTIFDNPVITLGILLGILVVPLGKKYITTPRIGRVKFSRERIGKMALLTGGIGVVVVITALLFFITVYVGNFPKILISFLMVAMIVSVFGLMAYYLDHFRLLIYGIFIASHEFIWVLYGRTYAGYYNLFLGSVFLFVGFLVLINFLQRYPKPKREGASL
jgi:hypothetical protein